MEQPNGHHSLQIAVLLKAFFFFLTLVPLLSPVPNSHLLAPRGYCS